MDSIRSTDVIHCYQVPVEGMAQDRAFLAKHPEWQKAMNRFAAGYFNPMDDLYLKEALSILRYLGGGRVKGAGVGSLYVRGGDPNGEEGRSRPRLSVRSGVAGRGQA